MSAIVDLLKSKQFFICKSSVAPDEIENAEKALGVSFATDYKEYIQECGTASYDGHELTGISNDLNLDVISITTKNLQRNPNIDIPLYVIEETHIDGIVIWQAPDQKVYQTGMKSKPVQIAESLTDYINLS